MSLKNQKLRLFGALAALATLALAISCRGFFVNPTVNSIVISPTNPTVPLGGTLQMHAFGTNDDGSSAGDITVRDLVSSLRALQVLSMVMTDSGGEDEILDMAHP